MSTENSEFTIPQSANDKFLTRMRMFGRNFQSYAKEAKNAGYETTISFELDQIVVRFSADESTTWFFIAVGEDAPGEIEVQSSWVI